MKEAKEVKEVKEVKEKRDPSHKRRAMENRTSHKKARDGEPYLAPTKRTGRKNRASRTPFPPATGRRNNGSR